jgi:A/G-specific adenine glycosylase
MLDPLRISALQDAVRANYAAHAKDLPWRTNATPYHVLVSEIMSQQTQIERVVPKYLARMEKFPDIYILAAVSQADVLTMRSGLGFNRRAINLHKCAQTIVDIYDGVIPNDPILLKKLP